MSSLPLASYGFFGRDGEKELIELLFEAIPEEDKVRLSAVPRFMVINGGTSRGWQDKLHAVATYNNTIPDEQGIIDWFTRALIGVRYLDGNETRSTQDGSKEEGVDA